VCAELVGPAEPCLMRCHVLHDLRSHRRPGRRRCKGGRSGSSRPTRPL
jgi:hypothetical protein